MSMAHVYFADMPLTSVGREGRSTMDSLNNDAMIRHCSTGDRHNMSPNSSDSPTPRYERNMGFFRQLSRRFGLRSNDDLVFHGSNEDDNQSSSTDSYNSQTAAVSKEKDNQPSQSSSLATAIAAEYISCASSDTSSTIDIEEQHQHLQQQQQQHSNDDYENNDNDKATNAGSDADADSNNDVKQSYNKDRKSFTRSSFSRLQRRSTSSIRRAFEAFSLSSRSLSCSGATAAAQAPPIMATTSSASSSTNNGTPIKSALKTSSNLELNKKSSSSSQSSSSAASAAKTNRCNSISCSSSSKTKTKPPPQRILRQPVSYTYLKGISGLPTQRVPRSSVCCQYARR